MPPPKNMVKVMIIMKNLRGPNFLRDSGYAASEVVMMPSMVPTTVYQMVLK